MEQRNGEGSERKAVVKADEGVSTTESKPKPKAKAKAKAEVAAAAKTPAAEEDSSSDYGTFLLVHLFLYAPSRALTPISHNIDLPHPPEHDWFGHFVLLDGPQRGYYTDL